SRCFDVFSKTTSRKLCICIDNPAFNRRGCSCYSGSPALTQGGKKIGSDGSEPSFRRVFVKKSYLPGVILFILTISLPAIIYSQQNGSARRQPTTSEGLTTKPSGSGSRVSSAMVKSDVSEALALIENNYVDGKTLEYNSVFKSSISGMLNAL